MPYSGIYPYYAQHVMAGVFCGANQMKLKQQDFSFVPVYVGQGGIKAVVDAVQKLLFFEGVDVITGMINTVAIPEIRPMLDTHQKLGLFFDMGERVLPEEGFGPNIRLISMNLWQAQYVLGQFAVKEFGRDGHVIAPVYEGGFSLNTAFFEGAAAAGSERMFSTILREESANSKVLSLDNFFKALENDTPDFVHAIFTGKLGNEFLSQWHGSKFYDTVPLLVVENMAYEDMLEDVKHLGLKIYAPSGWNRKTESVYNKKFVQDFEHFGKQQANIFGMMGYEIGLALSIMMPYLIKGDTQTALQYLAGQAPAGPRGKLSLNANGQDRPTIDIARIITSNHNINQTIIAQSSALGFDTTFTYQQTLSGWQNPYLSV